MLLVDQLNPFFADLQTAQVLVSFEALQVPLTLPKRLETGFYPLAKSVISYLY